jgi:tol-pal system protein YbgF
MILGGGASASLAQAAPRQLAQNYAMPPDNVGGGGDSQDNGGGYAPSQDNGGGGGYAPPGGGGSDASLLVRVEHLEDQIRQMTGQMQQMQFENHQLQDQLKKFEQDVDFRFQEGRGGHPMHRSEASPADVPPAAPVDADSTTPPADQDAGGTATAAGDTSHSGRDDAFDPTSHPDAPGAPKPLGAGESAPPPVADASGAGSDPNAPMNLQSAYTPPAAPAAPAAPAGGDTRPSGTMLASAEMGAPNSPRQAFDAALGYFKQKDYDNAERGFAEFLNKNPKTRLTPEALYFLGESYAARGRAREAAEQFLKISTNYSDSTRAPQAMLRLGESLRALGNKDEACAAFGEVPHKYPSAAAAVKAAARDAQRAKCGA